MSRTKRRGGFTGTDRHKRQKLTPKQSLDRQISNRPEQTEFERSIATLNPEDLAARFTKAIQKHQGDLSTIELEDQSVPAKAFRNTTAFAEPRVVQNLAQFLEQNTAGGADELKTCQEKASPHTLLVTLSAIRTTDLARAVRGYGSEDNKIAKLFAKNKLNNMVDYVQKTQFGIGAGTGKRIEDLIARDVLKIDKLRRVVVDASYTDEKKNTIFEDRYAFSQLLSLLNLESLKLRLFSGNTELLVF